ncbi:MAG TPA: cbb3-type cytochrome c oxidase subunit II [Flavobacteriaceae bacterium]|nr:cbb3-type cytochrome c oxidase subunit II [Flavobacteriaceae bacterium]
MFNFHKDLKMLMIVAGGIYLVLVFFVSIVPANDLAYVEPLPTAEPLNDMERKGLEVYVAENCVACHTQQVRNIEMDKMWGDRPSIPSDFYYDKQRIDVWRQSPSLLGSERTGPDLTNIGKRQPSEAWHLLHLYNPRSVVDASIMPSYAWLFEEKDSTQITEDDVVLNVPK